MGTVYGKWRPGEIQLSTVDCLGCTHTNPAVISTYITTASGQSMVGRTVSHYQIVEELGGGGMGVVYKAIDTRLNRPVAIKFVAAALTRDDDANERFRHEAQAASALDHPNICTIHEIDETPTGELFLVMAYYAGHTLKQRLDAGRLPVVEALDLVTQIANALARAHEAHIVHRDI